MEIARAFAYFPGCSLATSAKENNESLIGFLEAFGIFLEELEDWNCCGSSSAHSIDSDLAFQLSSRNLALADGKKPLLVACPGCYLRLKGTQLHLKADPDARRIFASTWDRPFIPDLTIVHFFELLETIMNSGEFRRKGTREMDLKIAVYYGCMLAHPPDMKGGRPFYGLMEKIIAGLGAMPVSWPHAARCCGTFLTVARPDIVTPLVERIMKGAVESGAECLVTACAMCHLNLEVRSARQTRIPIFHFSEILALAMGQPVSNGWFSRHLIDPLPLLEKKNLLGGA